MANENEDFSQFTPRLPEWIETKRIQDSCFSYAYETSPPRYRSALKTGIALSSFNFNFQNNEEKNCIKNWQKGFKRETCRCPCDWTIIIFDSSYSAAARICAAATLPILANVPVIFAIAIGSSIEAPLLCALELCGINDVFCISSAELDKFLWEIYTSNAFSPAKGKLVLLSAYSNSHIFSCYPASHIIRLPVKPNIKILAHSDADIELIKYAQNCMPEDFNPCLPVDCLINLSGTACKDEASATLVLGKGCEGFWLYPFLSPLSFSLIKTEFSLLSI